jgi:hypothetical protein
VTVSVSEGTSPLQVSFKVNQGEACGRFLWAFGDGLTSAEKEPVHIYTNPGTYHWVLKAYQDGYSEELICSEYPEGTGMQMVSYLVSGDITVTEALQVANLNKCIRIGLGGPIQGYGPSEYNGDYWPYPPAAIGGVECVDDKGIPHQVVFDQNSGTFREIGRYDGPDGSGMSQVWTDADYTGAEHEIDGHMELGEDTAELEQNTIQHMESYFGIRPEDEDKASTTGYDAFGYRLAQQIDATILLDD